jgi:hypothetical protein
MTGILSNHDWFYDLDLRRWSVKASKQPGAILIFHTKLPTASRYLRRSTELKIDMNVLAALFLASGRTALHVPVWEALAASHMPQCADVTINAMVIAIVMPCADFTGLCKAVDWCDGDPGDDEAVSIWLVE